MNFTAKCDNGAFFDKVVIKQRKRLTTIWSFLWFYATAYLVPKKIPQRANEGNL